MPRKAPTRLLNFLAPLLSAHRRRFCIDSHADTPRQIPRAAWPAEVEADETKSRDPSAPSRTSPSGGRTSSHKCPQPPSPPPRRQLPAPLWERHSSRGSGRSSRLLSPPPLPLPPSRPSVCLSPRRYPERAGLALLGAMKRSLWRLCQSREKAAASSAYQGVVCEADAASVASQDVFKVRGDGGPLGRCGDRGRKAGTQGWAVCVGLGRDGLAMLEGCEVVRWGSGAAVGGY